ncbi:MAG: SsrA-binding protein SmpB [Sphingomonadaceae bacterium]|uniref:SsrA-binding protein SmpB n=1 Tax=Thermaurantiacus sp. TaxID=2820283 RepID=UPI00298F2813|nr:SsrA-binding protein SmpB [Thermaurantiacus sp.]MCS6986469.1 SsrA-binding protein SmpB [Sphingomonadaceae bacterium]MDW8414270.1 SsrA-binding protein SmpB [Thermaurantiacus sp.]
MARAPRTSPRARVVAENRRARREYEVEERFEAGIVLTGTEVKSLRAGEAHIGDAYAEIRGDEAWLINASIPEFSHGNRFNHEPRRPRKLLLHAREIARLHGAVTREGMTLVPLAIYFTDRGRAKVELALARGRKLHDKRALERERDWAREKARLLRERG